MATTKCAQCGRAVSAVYSFCPHCGASADNIRKAAAGLETLVSLGGVVHEQHRTTRNDTGVSFVCPGCGDEATSEDGRLCRTCNAFVHRECMNKGKKIGGGFGGWLCGVQKWETICPICCSPLGGEIERVEQRGGGYAELVDGELLL